VTAVVAPLHLGPDVSRSRVVLGWIGEDLACAELERRGYLILARRYRRQGGEIDIIARDGETTVFVEVKARGGRAFGEAAEAVTAIKRRRITTIALDFLARRRLTDRPCRFDVVAIHIENERPIVQIFKNAFEPVGW
jgi:putative endonuclease